MQVSSVTPKRGLTRTIVVNNLSCVAWNMQPTKVNEEVMQFIIPESASFYRLLHYFGRWYDNTETNKEQRLHLPSQCSGRDLGYKSVMASVQWFESWYLKSTFRIQATGSLECLVKIDAIIDKDELLTRSKHPLTLHPRESLIAQNKRCRTKLIPDSMFSRFTASELLR